MFVSFFMTWFYHNILSILILMELWIVADFGYFRERCHMPHLQCLCTTHVHIPQGCRQGKVIAFLVHIPSVF